MSSNKSAHLGLHLWKPEDDFLRTEFNENSEKLDSAAAAARYVTLLDVTTTAEAAQVDLDVSHIDFTALWEAELFCGVSSDTTISFGILVNGLKEGYAASEPNTYGYFNGTVPYWGIGPLNGGRSSFRMLTDNPDARAILDYTTGFFLADTSADSFHATHKLGMAPITWRELKTINVVNYNSTFPVGTRFFMRGVKK